MSHNKSMNELTYTSPHTGRVYTIRPETYTRMGGNWYAGESLREVTETCYNFFFGDELVFMTHDLDTKALSYTVGEFEGVFAPYPTSARD